MAFNDSFHYNQLAIYSAPYGNDLSSHTDLNNPFLPDSGQFGQCVDISRTNFFPRRNILGVAGRDNIVLGGTTSNVNMSQQFFNRDIISDGVVNFRPAQTPPGIQNNTFKLRRLNLYRETPGTTTCCVNSTVNVNNVLEFSNQFFERVRYDLRGNADATTLFQSCIWNDVALFNLGRLQSVGNSPGIRLLFRECIVKTAYLDCVIRGNGEFRNSYFEGDLTKIVLWSTLASPQDVLTVNNCYFNNHDLEIDTQNQPVDQVTFNNCFFNNSQIDFNGNLYIDLQAAATALPTVFGVWQPSTNDTSFGNRLGAINTSYNNESLLDFSLRYNSDLWRAGLSQSNIAVSNLGYARVVNNSQGQGVNFTGTANIGDGLTLVNSGNDYRQTGVNKQIADIGFNIFTTSSPYEIDDVVLRGAARLTIDVNVTGALLPGTDTVPHFTGNYRIGIRAKFRCENVVDATQFLIDYPYYTQISPGIFETNFMDIGFNTKPMYDTVNNVGSGANNFGIRNVAGVNYYNPAPGDLIPIVAEQISSIVELNENAPTDPNIGFQGYTLIFKQNNVRQLDVVASNATVENYSNLFLNHTDEVNGASVDNGVPTSVNFRFGWGIDYDPNYNCDFDFSGIIDGVAQSFTRTNQPVNNIIIV